MDVVDHQVDAAERRMETLLESVPQAVSARYDSRAARIMVGLSSGLELALPPHLAEGLAGATDEQLSIIEISPAGLGLHWPLLDADLYVPGLLRGVFGSPVWMARLWQGQLASAALSKGGAAAAPQSHAATHRR